VTKPTPDADAIYDTLITAIPRDAQTPDLLDALTHLSGKAIWSLNAAIGKDPVDVDTLISIFHTQLVSAVGMIATHEQPTEDESNG